MIMSLTDGKYNDMETEKVKKRFREKVSVPGIL
jgi:hypothetical protein